MRWSQWSHDPYISRACRTSTGQCTVVMATALLCMLLQVTSCAALAECVIMEAKSLYGADLIFESPYKSDLISFINTTATHMRKWREKCKRKQTPWWEALLRDSKHRALGHDGRVCLLKRNSTPQRSKRQYCTAFSVGHTATGLCHQGHSPLGSKTTDSSFSFSPYNTQNF